MRITELKLTILAAGVLAFGVMAHAASNDTASIPITADIGSIENVGCTQTSIAFGAAITPLTSSGWTAPAEVNCTISTNDVDGDDVNIYVGGVLTTGGETPSTIASSNFGYNTDGGTSFTSLSLIGSGTYSGDYGALVRSTITTGPTSFYLGLNVPAGQAVGSYSGATLYVVVSPHAV
jgi:hypothetical protein